ncbi:MAG: helicase-related protein, partial [Coprobacillus sp.]
VESLCLFLNKHHLKAKKVSSLEVDNQKSLQLLKDERLDVLVSTTLLERGVTIEDVQVIVYQADHVLFDERTLIQIAGRVGRKPKHPTGYIYFLSTDKTKGIKGCIQTIKRLNQMNV